MTMPQPMPVPILTKRKSRALRATPGVLLAHRQHVDVVVEHDRAAQLAGDGVADRVAVPAGHDRRRHRHAAVEVDRAGHADAGAHRLVDPRLVEHLADHLERRGQHHLRALPDVAGRGAGWPAPQPAVGHPDRHAGGADRDADEPDLRGQVDQRRAPSAARGRRARPPGPGRARPAGRPRRRSWSGRPRAGRRAGPSTAAPRRAAAASIRACIGLSARPARE